MISPKPEAIIRETRLAVLTIILSRIPRKLANAMADTMRKSLTPVTYSGFGLGLKKTGFIFASGRSSTAEVSSGGVTGPDEISFKTCAVAIVGVLENKRGPEIWTLKDSVLQKQMSVWKAKSEN